MTGSRLRGFTGRRRDERKGNTKKKALDKTGEEQKQEERSNEESVSKGLAVDQRETDDVKKKSEISERWYEEGATNCVNTSFRKKNTHQVVQPVK